jgi:hypothetical protein
MPPSPSPLKASTHFLHRRLVSDLDEILLCQWRSRSRFHHPNLARSYRYEKRVGQPNGSRPLGLWLEGEHGARDVTCNLGWLTIQEV